MRGWGRVEVHLLSVFPCYLFHVHLNSILDLALYFQCLTLLYAPLSLIQPQQKKDIAAATELKSQAEHNVTTLKFQVESTHAQLIFVQRNVTDLKVKVQGWDLAKLKALAYHAMNVGSRVERVGEY